jgi:hypothetical protein
MRPAPANLAEANFVRNQEDLAKLGKKSPFLFVLRAYCVALLKGCYFVNELVKDELYYEVRSSKYFLK